MHITKIEALNIKGRSFSHELAPLTLITGKNRAGKSAILQAVRVALTGECPPLERTNAGVWRLWGGPRTQLALQVTFDTGGKSRYSLKKSGDSLKGGEEKFNAPAIPRSLLSMSDFFRMAAGDRAKFLLSKVDLSKMGLSAESLTAKVMMMPVEEWTAEKVAVRNEITDEIRLSFDDGQDGGRSIQDWLNSLVATLKGKAKEANDTKKRMKASVAAASQIESHQPAESARESSPALLEEKREALAALDAEKGQLEEKLRVATSNVGRRSALIQRLDNRASKQIEIGGLEKKIKALEQVTAGHKSTFKASFRAHLTETAKVDAIGVEIANVTADLASMAAELQQAQGSKCCPECGSKSAKWLIKRKKAVADLMADIITKQEHLATLKDHSEKQNAIAAAAKVRADADEKADIDHEMNSTTLTADRALLVEARESDIVTAGMRAELAGLEAQAPVDCKTLQDTLARIGAERLKTDQDFRSLQSEVRRLTMAQQDAIRKEEARQHALQNEAEAEVYAAALKVIEDDRAKAIEDSFAQVLVKTLEFTERMGYPPILFRDGEFGWIEHGVWITHLTMSQSEQAVVYSALCLALTAEAPFRLVLLDELGLFDPKTKGVLLTMMQDLIRASEIHQAILVDPDRELMADALVALQSHVDPVPSVLLTASRKEATVPAQSTIEQ